MSTVSNLTGIGKRGRSAFVFAALSFGMPILSLLFVYLTEKEAALSLHTVLLSGLSALSAFVYFKRRRASDMAALIVSIAYSLSAFSLLASEIALTLSLSLILFPAVILGAELIAEGKTVFPFALSLSMILLLADNLSVVALIAALLWFILRLMEVEAETASGVYRSIRFALSVAAAFFIAAVRFLPRLLAIDVSLLFAEGEAIAPIWLIPAKLLPSVYDSVLQAASPFLYIGLLPLLLLPLFFGCKGVSKKQKILSSVFLAVLFLLGTMPFFSAPYTLLGDTVSFRYGGTLPLILFLLLLAAKGLDTLKEERSNVYAAAAGVILTLLVLYQQYNAIFTKETDENYLIFPLFETLWLTIGAVFLYLCLIPLLSRVSKPLSRAAVLFALLLVLLSEMSVSAAFTLKTASGELASMHRVSSPTYTLTYTDAPEGGEEYGELVFRRYERDGQKLFIHSTVGDVSPSEEEALNALLSSFGVEKSGDTYEGMSPVLALLSGTLYTDKQMPYYTSPADLTEEQLYEADFYLSIGAAVSEAVLSYSPDETNDPFTELSRFVSCLTGEDTSLFSSVSEANGIFWSSSDCLLVSVDGKVTAYYGNSSVGTSVERAALGGNSVIAAEINDAALKKAMRILYEYRFEVTEATLGKLSGNLYAQNGNTVFCTNLPYSDTYTVTVDKETAEPLNINGLLALRVEGGQYQYVTICYEPTFLSEKQLLPVTASLSITFTLLLLSWMLLALFDKKKPLFKRHPAARAILFSEVAKR